MKNIVKYTCAFISATCLFFMILSCNNNSGSKNNNRDSVNSLTTLKAPAGKSPSTYRDTLIINFPSAVFYHPDSLQLSRIKALTDTMYFDGSMHEYFYQMRNARIVLKKNWPQVSIIESERCRYLLFIKKDGTREYIDLDTKNDPYGLFVFDGIQSPVMIDMTNIETIVGFYFSKQ
ncbi:MAG: hypothetical protein ACXWCZ_10880 [Flavisolibacter sp.]